MGVVFGACRSEASSPRGSTPSASAASWKVDVPSIDPPLSSYRSRIPARPTKSVELPSPVVDLSASVVPDSIDADPAPKVDDRPEWIKCGPAPELMQSWRARHEKAADDFRTMLLQIRAEGAQKFNNGLWSLWQAAEALDPVREQDKEDVDNSASALHSGYHLIADLDVIPEKRDRSEVGAVADVAQRWLLSFEINGRYLSREHAEVLERRNPNDKRQAEALLMLVKELARLLSGSGTDGLRFCPSSSGASCYRVMPLGLSEATVDPENKELTAGTGAWAVLPLIWLPLALYVRSTTHLYEMLERLQRKAVLHRGGGEQPDAKDGAGILRKLLDRDERCYSYLVFATTAALQALHLARQDMGLRFPVSLLGSSPPDPAHEISNGYPMQRAREFGRTQEIFRGVWVGKDVDEERTRFQYSFQSFSREVEGMNRVLSFYASIDGNDTTKLAREVGHVLVLVGRVTWHQHRCLAMPVQLLDGPRESASSECEVLLPPYVRYTLEEDLAISSADFDGPNGQTSECGKAKLATLYDRWGGFELPAMLFKMLRRQAIGDEFRELDALRPFVSVRFVRNIELPESLEELFFDANAKKGTRLYDFPCKEAPLFSRRFGRFAAS